MLLSKGCSDEDPLQRMWQTPVHCMAQSTLEGLARRRRTRLCALPSWLGTSQRQPCAKCLEMQMYISRMAAAGRFPAKKAGRRGECLFLARLSYTDANNLFLVPAAHGILHGAVKDFWGRVLEKVRPWTGAVHKVTKTPYPWHGADVIFMAMRDDDCLNLRPPPMQEARVWQDLLHAQVCEAANATEVSPFVLKATEDCP